MTFKFYALIILFVTPMKSIDLNLLISLRGTAIKLFVYLLDLTELVEPNCFNNRPLYITVTLSVFAIHQYRGL